MKKYDFKSFAKIFVPLIIVFQIIVICAIDICSSPEIYFVDTIVIEKHALTAQGADNPINYVISLRTEDSVFFKDMIVDPVIYYTIGIGSHVRVEISVSIIFERKTVSIWSFEEMK